MNHHQPIPLVADIEIENEFGYDEDFTEPPPDDYTCPICLLICKEAMQTKCGHRFCKTCIMKVITEAEWPNSCCPMDKTELDETDVFPDNSARKEIFQLKVRCRKKDEGCVWVGGLGDLNKHMEMECELAFLECPNKCRETMSRKDLENHILNECSRRIVECPDCRMKVVLIRIDEHTESCAMRLTDCPNACGMVPRGELSQHLQTRCPKSVLSCRFREFGCRYEGFREAMKDHVTEEQENHFTMMSDVIKTLKLTCERLDFELKQTQWKSECLKLSARLSELEQKSDILEKNEISTLREQVQSLTVMSYNNESSIMDIRSKMHNGCLFWKIENFAQLFQEAKDGTTLALNSFAFYTNVPGYKMYIRVNLNGVDRGFESHVSMYVHMMQGEYDHIIDWPFVGTITLTVMDQKYNKHHMVEKLVGNPSIAAFRRPTLQRNNKGYGYAEMFPHCELTERGFLVNDCLLIKIEVQEVGKSLVESHSDPDSKLEGQEAEE